MKITLIENFNSQIKIHSHPQDLNPIELFHYDIYCWCSDYKKDTFWESATFFILLIAEIYELSILPDTSINISFINHLGHF